MNKKKTLNNKKVIQKSIKRKNSVKNKKPKNKNKNKNKNNDRNKKSKEEYIFKDISCFNPPFTDHFERFFMVDNYPEIFCRLKEKNKNLKYIDPLKDYLVKKALFVPESKELYLILLNAIFEDIGCPKIENIEFKENKILASLIDQKDVELDSHVVADEKISINLEVQLKDHDDLDKRLMFYERKVLELSLPKGKDFSEIPEVIQILIAGFTLNDCEDFHYITFEIIYKFNEIFSKAHRRHVIEMDKFKAHPERIDLNNQLHRILLTLNYDTSKELMKEILKDPVVRELNRRIINPLIDPSEFVTLLNEEIKERETNQLINDANKKGRVEIALNLLEKEMPLDFISETTGLSIEEVEKLIEKK
ncbi:MAG: Rpn family recombination-promoting nuclease/putative transposase [Methanobrevibacter sp.]|nr:Rpn family recombination-promoting nuclease/putative transposase [Methanobrevibacter sp.]